MVLGFRPAKNIGIYGVFCSESCKNTWKQHLFDNFRPLRNWEKSCRGSSNNNNNSSSNNNNNKIAVFPAGPEQQPLDRSDPCRTSTARTGSERCPPDLNHKGSPKIYPIECQKELQKTFEIKFECQIECQKICQTSVAWWGLITRRK